MKIKNIFLLIIIMAAAFALAKPSQAAVCSDYSYLEVVARDASGAFIPGVKAELYRQVIDADGNKKPSTRITSATANDNTGIATLKFRNSDALTDVYAVRLQSIIKDFASFWYYDVQIACGETVNVEKTLSAVEIILRDYDGNLLYNTDFSLYTQRADVDGNPVKERKDLVASLDSGATGAAKVYVPQGSLHSLDNSQGDYYVAEISRNKKKFLLYDIKVNEGQTTSVTYNSSAMKVFLRNSLGALFPGGSDIEVYKQDVSGSNDQVQGEKVGEFETNDDGYGIFEAEAGIYVLAFKDSNGQYEYLWDVEIWNGQLNEYDWTLNLGQNTVGTCATKSNLNLSFFGLGGEALSGIKYEVFEQSVDSFGRPIAGNKVGGGTINSFGRADLSFKPDPRKNYVIRAYQHKADLGEFWFFDAVRFTCGDDRSFSRSLPYLQIVLRDGQGNLKKDTSFSIYEQSYDADNKPIKDKNKLIANLKTGSNGAARIYLGPLHPFNQSKRGLYVFSATLGKTTFDAYNVAVDAQKNVSFEYTFSDLSLNVRATSGQAAVNYEVKLYEQIKEGNNYRLGELLSSGRTDDTGNIHFEYPAGTYALVVADSFKQENVFWQAIIKDGQTNRASLNLNVTKVSLTSSLGESMPAGAALKLYSLYQANDGRYYRDKEIGTMKLKDNKQGEAWLAEGPYLIVYSDKNQGEFGTAFWARNNQINTINVKMSKEQLLSANQSFSLSKPSPSMALMSVSAGSQNDTPVANNASLEQRVAGYILLQVEDKGQAWYMNPADSKRYYLANGSSAFAIMRRTGVGISNDNLSKIPIGLDNRFKLKDSDGDLLPDGLETAIGTDPYNSDSDGDSYLDGEELRANYNPLGGGSLKYDQNFANKQKGKIFLQVESHGEAWYVNPADSKRYYLGDGASAFEIMRYLSLGISNQNLNQLNIGQ